MLTVACSRPMSTATGLKALSPTEFENLTYDLMVATGLRNVTWRTPGADGGRDIEGEHFVMDLSGEATVDKWYVECKRYETSLNWPLVREKVAYAENHLADYLLISTTSDISPKCRDEIATWNIRRPRPRIRVWSGEQLATRIATHPPLLVKYGLTADPTSTKLAILPLALMALKALHAAYGAASIGM